MSKFKDGDKVVVSSGKYAGVEGVVQWEEETVPIPMYFIKVTKASKGYTLGDTDSFGEELLELVKPDIREVGKKIKPELVRVGDKIRAVRASDYGIEDSRGGVVARIQKKDKGLEFFNEFDAYIGWSYTCLDYVLEEESTIHELTLAPVGTKFKAVRGPGSYHYMIYTKYREGWWICEAYDKHSNEFAVITVRSEKTTINEFDKGRSTYL